MAMKLSGRIKIARQHLAQTIGRKVSQKELGEMCGGWSQNRISNYEAGTRTAPPADCQVIANITGVRIEWLQLESGPMLESMIKEKQTYYKMNPPIIEWHEIDNFLANPKDFDFTGKERSPFAINNEKAFAVVLPQLRADRYNPTKIAIILPIEKDENLTNQEVMCRCKMTGEKALKFYASVFGAISLIDPAKVFPPITLEQDSTIEIIGRVMIKYE